MSKEKGDNPEGLFHCGKRPNGTGKNGKSNRWSRRPTPRRMRHAKRTPHANETTAQRLRRILRERKGEPHHEDYCDGNPDKEMRVRHTQPMLKAPSRAELEEMGRVQCLRAQEMTGKRWVWELTALHEEGDPEHWTLELRQVE